ncbi:MAG TPA: metal ABC transporter permease, partial [Oligoflexia bacterium]|nr:metal ABC transporter permease [Oligoflexia bacterium]
MLVSSNIDYAVAVFTLQSGLNTAIVLLGTTCLGVASGIVGSFSLLRKRALMGDALAHGTLPGVCISFLLLAVVFQSERSLT